MKMGQLYKEMGFVNTGHTVQATRADLVGQYIGHTGPKTREMITRSFGGILFIDEAYGLYKEDSRDYGSEVIEMLVKFIDMTENKDFVLVLAGYRNLMTRMLNANLNLMSRMGNWIGEYLYVLSCPVLSCPVLCCAVWCLLFAMYKLLHNM
jgi:ATPase family associated with various cellular activities (AAA)